MYKKTITYTDYSDTPQKLTETFYFELTFLELAENGWVDNSLQTELNRCVDTNNLSDLLKLFKKLVKASYGKRSADRKSFVKDEADTKAFMQSRAYEELITEMVSDDTGKALQNFIIGVLPKEINGQKVDYDEAMKQARKQMAENYGIEMVGDSDADDSDSEE